MRWSWWLVGHAAVVALLAVAASAQNLPDTTTLPPNDVDIPTTIPNGLDANITILNQVRAGACTELVARREFRTLSQAERDTFVRAVRQIQAGPNSIYDQLVRIHWNVRDQVHNYAPFFPWHRLYIAEFERALQAINPNITLPYWDWSYDSQAPEFSPVFSNSFMGGNSWGDCLRSGPFASMILNFPQRKCLTRHFDRGRRLSAFAPPEQIMAIVYRTNTYREFREMLETPPHNSVHNNIGGDMSTMYSSNDPLFYLHHAFVDKLWDDWQRANGGRRFLLYEGDWNYDSAARLDDQLWPFRQRVREVMDTRRLCYYYEPFVPSRANMQLLEEEDPGNGVWDIDEDAPEALRWQRSVAVIASGGNANTTDTAARSMMNGLGNGDGLMVVPADDRTELVALRTPRPLPDRWLTMNNLNITRVREIERKLMAVIDRVNRLPHYVSPSALIRQDSVVEAIAESITDRPRLSNILTATVAGNLSHVHIDQPMDSEEVNVSDNNNNNNNNNTSTASETLTSHQVPSHIVSAMRHQISQLTGVDVSDRLVLVTEELQKILQMAL